MRERALEKPNRLYTLQRCESSANIPPQNAPVILTWNLRELPLDSSIQQSFAGLFNSGQRLQFKGYAAMVQFVCVYAAKCKGGEKGGRTCSVLSLSRA